MEFQGFVKTAIIFAIGFAIGAFYQDKKVRDKYEKQYQDFADEQIDDCRRMYQDRVDTMNAEIEAKAKEKGIEYAMEKMDLRREDGTSIYDTRAYTYELLPPDKLGEMDEYEVEYLTYYADGKLAYDTNAYVVDDPERLVGPEALKSFGKFVPDLIHVRNHLYRKDYEISRSELSYEDFYWKDIHEEDD